MSIDYTLPAMRQELVRIDDAKPPRGGGAGGYNPQTFQGGIRPIPGDIIQNQTIDGRTQNGAIDVLADAARFPQGDRREHGDGEGGDGARQEDAVVHRVRQVPDHRARSTTRT